MVVNNAILLLWMIVFRNIQSLPTLTRLARRDPCVEALTKGIYDPRVDVYCEWHHKTPICMNGSVESDGNLIRLPYELHLQVHIALAHLFPSVDSLQHCVTLMAQVAENKLDEQELIELFHNKVRDFVYIKQTSIVLLLTVSRFWYSFTQGQLNVLQMPRKHLLPPVAK